MTETLNEQTLANTEEAKQEQTAEQEIPEFALDKDGNFVLGDLLKEQLDKLKAEEKQDAEVQEQNTKTEKVETKPYTLEEFRQTPFEKLDPNRIPAELMPFYKSMQADYTRKTQEVARQRKEIEQIEKDIAERIKYLDMATKAQVPVDVVLTASKQAQEYLKQQLGDAYDEYNPQIQQAQAVYAREIIENYKQTTAAQQRLQAAEQYLRQVDGDIFPQVEQMALYMLENEMTVREVAELNAAREKRDPAPLLKLYARARERVVGKPQPTVQMPQQTQTPQAKPVVNPPIIETGGKGETARPKPSYKPTIS